MSILPQYGLIQYRNATRIYTKTVNESLQLFKQEPRDLMVSVFIFHKHDELEELDSAINFLNSFGELVYADWIDEDMYENTTEATKRIHITIKEKIKENQKFIFLATESALNSKMGKWVLGQLHGQKNLDHIAIFPIRGDYSDYSGEEYLGKYPYIHEIESEVYGVEFPDQSTIELGTWLSSK
ncbi:hypothetical protein U6A24_08480 [Aquimarina gracilis]|uniref:TIR domain-containing protein n=1 Tax=Aquimarina gracilis TaxID=874422 RepID=A0ABU5ZTU0_9FLAO|nr:hypothetical protein [Aquimarina gracilis]MEB3345491.1 hypothetical protein [Aquimarina gracilis]